MSEQLLTVFKLCLLAVLYLFFLRVLRAVWVETRGVPARRGAAVAPAGGPVAPPAAPVAPPRPAGPQLVILEPEAQRGRTFPLVDELTIGRAPGCHISVDDRFVSQLHARVFARGGQHFVEDLGSTNGTFLGDQKVDAPALVSKGGRVRVGSTVMELR